MENLTLYNSKSIRFIKILHRLLLIFVAITVLLLVFLKINDSVSYTEGIVYSDNPQVVINSPNEVRVLDIKVKEGDEVKKGDTLLVLENTKIQSDYNVANMDIQTMKNKIVMLQKLKQYCVEKKGTLQQMINIQSNIYKTDKQKTKQELKNLNNKIQISNKQSNYINENFKVDSILYSKGAISKLELKEQNNRILDDKKQQIDQKSTYSTKNYDYDNLSNNYLKSKTDLRASIIEIENQTININTQILDLESQINNQNYNLTFIKDELGKLNVISPFKGSISNLFNSKQNKEIVNKDELLITIIPENENYYAKIIIPEKDLTYIKVGQDVNLKIDAYNYYKYGALKGKITFLSNSNVEGNFYCLVKIYNTNKNIKIKTGYKLNGNIIIEEMRLYEYILKKMFNNLSSTPASTIEEIKDVPNKK